MTEGNLACLSYKLKQDGAKYEMGMFQTMGAPANEKAVFFYAVTELWRNGAAFQFVC
jgi:hypothetical protein